MWCDEQTPLLQGSVLGGMDSLSLRITSIHQLLSARALRNLFPLFSLSQTVEACADEYAAECDPYDLRVSRGRN